MESLSARLADLRRRIDAAARAVGRDPASVELMAVTKTVEAARVRACIEAGITLVGENRVQEMQEKDRVGAYRGARLHFIGHLQRNKVADVVGRVELIQSIDSLRLAQAVEEQAGRQGLVQEVLLEINIGGETTKGGFPPEDAWDATQAVLAMPHVALRGFMCIPPPAIIAPVSGYFAQMNQLFVDISSKIGDNASVDILSMGMSDDFEEAIRAGSTMVRLGSALLGSRDTSPSG